MNKLADYCQIFADASLMYICNEDIKETIYTPPRFENYSFRGQTQRNNYTYDYQLIYKDGSFQEKRALLEENGKKLNEQDAPLKVKRSPYELLISGPVGLFSSYWQQYYDYTILKSAKLKGEKALVIDVAPKPGYEHQYLYGKAWVSASSFNVLKIEYSQQALENIEKIRESSKKLGLVPDIVITTEFSYEKNGIRFPSDCLISECYKRTNAVRKYHKSLLRISYSNYKFFTVETHIDFKKKALPDKQIVPIERIFFDL